MKNQSRAARKIGSGLANVALAIGGVGLALVLVELFFRANPNWVPRTVRVDPPIRRVQARVVDDYTVRLSNGDLFYWMRGAIAPLSPADDRVVATVHLTTDADGFRNPLPLAPVYDIVALGDSFTVANNVGAPWPERLAALTGSSVLNLGSAGAGPQQELKILSQYGLARQPRWVVLAYFEGNDLYDAAAYDVAQPYILPRVGRYLLNEAGDAWHDQTTRRAQAATTDFRYPMTVTINGTGLKMAFFSAYVAWLAVSDEMLAASQNYQLVTETLADLQATSTGAGARLLVVYVPTKLHVYWPFLDGTDALAKIFVKVPTLAPDRAGFLQLSRQPASPALAAQHLNDQARLLADFAAQQQIDFLDLTPGLQVAAGTGEELYYPFDTHWNQRGHDLAAELIAAYLETR